MAPLVTTALFGYNMSHDFVSALKIMMCVEPRITIQMQMGEVGTALGTQGGVWYQQHDRLDAGQADMWTTPLATPFKYQRNEGPQAQHAGLQCRYSRM